MISFLFVSGLGMLVLAWKFWASGRGLLICFCLKELEGGRSLDAFRLRLFARFVWLDVSLSFAELHGAIIGEFLQVGVLLEDDSETEGGTKEFKMDGLKSCKDLGWHV